MSLFHRCWVIPLDILKLTEVYVLASVVVIHLTVSDMSSVSPCVVFHYREAGQEASHGRGFCHDGHLQCWNHIIPHFTGLCFRFSLVSTTGRCG